MVSANHQERKNSTSRIRKEVLGTQHVRFFLPGNWFDVLQKPAVLELTPTSIRLNDKRYGVDHSWSIPTTDLSPLHVTWMRVPKERLLLGLNYQKKTYEISSLLTKSEIKELTQELKTFLSDVSPVKSSKQSVTRKFKKQVHDEQHIQYFWPSSFKGLRDLADILRVVGFGFLLFVIFAFFDSNTTGGTSLSFFMMVVIGGGLIFLPSLTKRIVKKLKHSAQRNFEYTLAISPTLIRFKHRIGKTPFGKEGHLDLSMRYLPEVTWHYTREVPIIVIFIESCPLEFHVEGFSEEEVLLFMHEIQETILAVKVSMPAQTTLSYSLEPEEENLEEQQETQSNEQETPAFQNSRIEEIDIHNESKTLQFGLPLSLTEKIIFSATKEGFEFVIPLGKWSLVTSVTYWICWPLFVSGVVYFEESEIHAAILVFLGGLVLSGVFFFSEFREDKKHPLKETIQISSNRITLKRSYPLRVEEIHHDLARIRNFRFGFDSEEFGKNGVLLFDEGTEKVFFGLGLTTEEARDLLHTITGIMASRCHSTERIVFGSLPAGLAISETLLHNPDVTELTLPYIRLKQVIIDTATYDFHLVERFMTYAMNIIGQTTLKEHVEVHLYGNPDHLHPNLRNLMESVCQRVVIH